MGLGLGLFILRCVCVGGGGDKYIIRLFFLVNLLPFFVLYNFTWPYWIQYVFYLKNSIWISCAMYACTNKHYAFCIINETVNVIINWPLKAWRSLFTISLQFVAASGALIEIIQNSSDSPSFFLFYKLFFFKTSKNVFSLEMLV